jgi:hypothetical protein
MDDRSGEDVRSLSTVLLPDPRNLYWVILDRRNSTFRSRSIEDACDDASDLDLPDGVELDVRQQFDLARNLLVYTWFVYRFHAVSQLQALRALELALRRRVSRAKGRAGMKWLLEEAVRTGVLTPEDFAAPTRIEPLGSQHRDAGRAARGEPALEEWQHMVESLRSFRNDLAHGEPWLHPNTRLLLAVVRQLVAALARRRPLPRLGTDCGDAIMRRLSCSR